MQITCRIDRTLSPDARMIRKAVFIEEQGVQNEFDQTDETAFHLVLYADGAPAAVARLFAQQDSTAYTVGRIAVCSPSMRKTVILLRAASILTNSALIFIWKRCCNTIVSFFKILPVFRLRFCINMIKSWYGKRERKAGRYEGISTPEKGVVSF